MDYLQKMRQFHQLGCTDAASCSSAFRLHSDLSRSTSNYGIVPKYDAELDIIYFTVSTDDAESDKSQPKDMIYVAVPSLVDIRISQITRIQSKLCHSADKRSIVMALVDGDSTIMYYKMSQGFLDLATPRSSEASATAPVIGYSSTI